MIFLCSAYGTFHVYSQLCNLLCFLYIICRKLGFSLRNGGMFNVQFLGVKISSMVNPLSAITPSFGSSSSTSPDLRVISRSLIDPV